MTRSGRSVGRSRSSLFGSRDQPVHDTIGLREADRNESESRSNERNQRLSFQAYLDTIEEKTGLTPRQLLELAQQKGFSDPSVKAGAVTVWPSCTSSRTGRRSTESSWGRRAHTETSPIRCGSTARRRSRALLRSPPTGEGCTTKLSGHTESRFFRMSAAQARVGSNSQPHERRTMRWVG